MKKLITICALAVMTVSAMAAPKTYGLFSPNGKITVSVETGENLTYTLYHGEDLIIDKSETGHVKGFATSNIQTMRYL